MNCNRGLELFASVVKTAGIGDFSLLVLAVGFQLVIAACESDDAEGSSEDPGQAGDSVAVSEAAGSVTSNSSEATGGGSNSTGGSTGPNIVAGAGGAAGRSTGGVESAAGGAIDLIEGGEGGSNTVAGAGGAAGQDEGDGGDEQGDAGEDPDGGPDTQTRRCRSTGSQVVLVGDSYISWITHNFPEDMNAVVGQTVHNYAIGGFSMASGGLGLIPPQLDLAIETDPDILIVVMSGGGNDILIPDILQFPEGGRCKEEPDSASIPDCQAIVNLAVDTAVENMDKLVDAGIPDVIYFFYPQVPSTWLASNPNGILGYALPLAQKACDGAYARTDGKLTCHFVDLNPVFEGHPEYFAEADLHPSPEGSAAMADKIWEVMVDNCIAQPESSGCCSL